MIMHNKQKLQGGAEAEAYATETNRQESAHPEKDRIPGGARGKQAQQRPKWQPTVVNQTVAKHDMMMTPTTATTLSLMVPMADT